MDKYKTKVNTEKNLGTGQSPRNGMIFRDCMSV